MTICSYTIESIYILYNEDDAIAFHIIFGCVAILNWRLNRRDFKIMEKYNNNVFNDNNRSCGNNLQLKAGIDINRSEVKKLCQYRKMTRHIC